MLRLFSGFLGVQCGIFTSAAFPAINFSLIVVGSVLLVSQCCGKKKRAKGCCCCKKKKQKAILRDTAKKGVKPPSKATSKGRRKSVGGSDGYEAIGSLDTSIFKPQSEKNKKNTKSSAASSASRSAVVSTNTNAVVSRNANAESNEKEVKTCEELKSERNTSNTGSQKIKKDSTAVSIRLEVSAADASKKDKATSAQLNGKTSAKGEEPKTAATSDEGTKSAAALVASSKGTTSAIAVELSLEEKPEEKVKKGEAATISKAGDGPSSLAPKGGASKIIASAVQKASTVEMKEGKEKLLKLIEKKSDSGDTETDATSGTVEIMRPTRIFLDSETEASKATEKTESTIESDKSKRKKKNKKGK